MTFRMPNSRMALEKEASKIYNTTHSSAICDVCHKPTNFILTESAAVCSECGAENAPRIESSSEIINYDDDDEDKDHYGHIDELRPDDFSTSISIVTKNKGYAKKLNRSQKNLQTNSDRKLDGEHVYINEVAERLGGVSHHVLMLAKVIFNQTRDLRRRDYRTTESIALVCFYLALQENNEHRTIQEVIQASQKAQTSEKQFNSMMKHVKQIRNQALNPQAFANTTTTITTNNTITTTTTNNTNGNNTNLDFKPAIPALVTNPQNYSTIQQQQQPNSINKMSNGSGNNGATIPSHIIMPTPGPSNVTMGDESKTKGALTVRACEILKFDKALSMSCEKMAYQLSNELPGHRAKTVAAAAILLTLEAEKKPIDIKQITDAISVNYTTVKKFIDKYLAHTKDKPKSSQ